MASKEQNERATAARLADLLKAERTRHGICEGSLTSLIKAQKRYIASLRKQIQDLQEAYVKSLADNLASIGNEEHSHNYGSHWPNKNAHRSPTAAGASYDTRENPPIEKGRCSDWSIGESP
jgi:restriction endonuclease S subunit